MADTVLAVHLSDLPFGTMLHLMGVLQLFLFNKQVKTLKKKVAFVAEPRDAGVPCAVTIDS